MKISIPSFLRTAWAAFVRVLVAEWNRPSSMDNAIHALIEAGEAGRRAALLRALAPHLSPDQIRRAEVVPVEDLVELHWWIFR